VSNPNIKLGWKAELNLSFEKSIHKTILANRSQSGPLTVQRPFYPENDICHLYILHPPGGVVGGDELHINVDLCNQASALITTPGATKFYRSGMSGNTSGNMSDDVKSADRADHKESSPLAQQIQTLKIADGCSLEWFPQENIFFHQTHSHLSTRVELEENARFMGWEINCYGRPASNELFKSGKVMTRLEIYRNSEAVFLDRLLIEDTKALQSPASLNTYPCFGTFISTHATQELLDKARLSIEEITDQNQQQTGITLLDDLLIVRCLGQHAEQVSTTLKAVWSAIRLEIMERPVCLPRIWST